MKKGLGLVTKGVQARQEWPAELSASLKEAKRNKEGALYAKIEVAGTSLYEYYGGRNTTNLIGEQGPAFTLPLKVRLINPWLEKLGGGPCTVGNDEYPIVQRLTSEAPGRASEPGGFSFNEAFTQVETLGSRLVDLNWSVPAVAAATGCGGEYESYVNGALNEIIELPGQHGTNLQGTLLTGNAKAVQKALEEELP